MKNSDQALLADATTLTLSIGEGADAISGTSLKVYRVFGHEAISEPFRYVVEFLSVDSTNTHDPLDSDDVLGHTATLEVSVDDGGANSDMSRRIHGIIDEFTVEMVPGADASDRYTAVLVPRLASLARNRQNRIHATTAPQSLADILRAKLLSRGVDYRSGSGNVDDGRVAIPADEFRIDIVDDDVPVHALSHVAQYNESDLNFIRRLCENHGVHFFFASDADDARGMVVFGNTNSPFGVVRFDSDPRNSVPESPGQGSSDNAAPTTYPDRDKLDIELTLTGATGLVDGSQYTPAGEHSAARLEGALHSFTSVHRPGPGRVRVLADMASGETAGDGQGIYTDYDTHFSDDSDGNDTETPGERFAAIRKQEMAATSNFSVGLTNSPCIAHGRVFKVETAPATYTHYLVTEATIDVRRAYTNIITEIDGTTIDTGIRNRFRCVEFDPASVDDVYRPPRMTPTPRLPGVYTAYVTTGDDDGPMPDADGAYEVHNRFLDDRHLPDASSPSAPVPKAEPYAGEDVGMHFPLKKDTEVLLAFRNGDPDRPVIAAALPGPSAHRSPVTSLNPTSHVLHTSFGARFEVHDDYADERSRVSLRSHERFEQASYLRLGKKDTPGNGSNRSDSSATLEAHYVDDVFAEQSLGDVFSSSDDPPPHDGIALLAADNIVEATSKNKITLASENIHARSLATHLLRGRRMVIFSGHPDDEPTGGTNTRSDQNPGRMADDDLFIHSTRNMYMRSKGDIHNTALGSLTIEIGDDTTEEFHRDLHTHVWADEHKLVMGSSNSLILGASTSLIIGARVFTSVGVDLSVLGPVVGYLGYGAGAYVWPQLAAFHGVVMSNVCESILVMHCPNVKESALFSIKHQAVSCSQSAIRTVRSACYTRLAYLYATL